MKVFSKSIHKVTLVFLQHLHHGLQLCHSEALFEGVSSLKGDSRPSQETLILQRVCLQTGLPQPGPETAAKQLICITTGQ